MASNQLPVQLDYLFMLAEDMADGLHAYGAAIGIQQNNETVIRAALTEAKAAEEQLGTKLQEKTRAVTSLTIADSNAKAFLATAQRALEKHLGETSSASWAEIGWPSFPGGVPKTVAERQACLSALQAYLASHTRHQDIPLQVTSAKAGACLKALSDARISCDDAIRAAAEAKAVRDFAVQTLRVRMNGLIKELSLLLPKDHAKWYAFGLNRPVDLDLPDSPESLVLTAGATGSGTVYAGWGDIKHAERYRVRKKVVGMDTDFVPVASPTSSDAILTGLPAGAVVAICVTAANAAGESQPGDTREIVVP